MAYRPRFQNQHSNWPEVLPGWYAASYAYYDCWARVGSWVVDGATGGNTVPGVVDIRKELNKLSKNVYADGAGSGDDVEHAVQKSDIQFTQKLVSVSEARSILTTSVPGRYIWVPTDYRAFIDPCDPHFASLAQPKHAIGVISGANVAQQVTVMDSTCHGYKKLPVDEVLAAMQLYSKDHGIADKVYIGYNTTNTSGTTDGGWGGRLGLAPSTIVDTSIIARIVQIVDDQLSQVNGQNPFWLSHRDEINQTITSDLNQFIGKPVSAIPTSLSVLPLTAALWEKYKAELGNFPEAISSVAGGIIPNIDYTGIVQYVVIFVLGLVLLLGAIYLLRPSKQTLQVESA